MTYDDFVFGDRLMDMRVQEEHRRADVRRMAREARIGGKNRLSQHGALMLYRLGNLLERFGRWLEQGDHPTDSIVTG